jgi:hypothetical protein
MADSRKQFAVFEHSARGPRAVSLGFSWPAALLPSLWALVKGRFYLGLALLAVDVCAVLMVVIAWRSGADLITVVLRVLVGLAIGVWTGRHGAELAAEALEDRGFVFSGIVLSGSAASACTLVKSGSVQPVKSRAALAPRAFSFIPRPLQSIAAIAGLTWRSAIRFRLFWAMMGLLLLCVTVLPLMLKDDGTARGFIQIMLTYTLSIITALLGFSTLWTACGTLAKDIEDCQMQMVVTKPVARWQIWVGKWIGLVSLNAVLLGMAGISIYAMLTYRYSQLPPVLQEELRSEVFVARAALKEKPQDIRADVERITAERIEGMGGDRTVAPVDREEVRKQVQAKLVAEQTVVPPGYQRVWKIDVGTLSVASLQEQMQIRLKFQVARTNESGLYQGVLQVGPPETDKLKTTSATFAPGTFHEIPIPRNLVDDNGILTITFINPNDVGLMFPLDEGMEVLYRDGGFQVNFLRGLLIIFCWLALFAAVGLAAGSFLSFPVASLVAVAVFIVGMSSSTLQGVVDEGTFLGSDHDSGKPLNPALDFVMVPVFRLMLTVVNFSQGFSPVDSLSTGRSITWISVGRAFVQVVVFSGGCFALFGIWRFNRRELAASQASS